MMLYPFNHECQWAGPFYIWTSNQVDSAPPPGTKPVYSCWICGAQQPQQEPHDIGDRP